MPDILVRGVSQEAVDTLKARAKANGTSLNAVLNEVLASAADTSKAQADWDRLRRFRDSAKGKWKGPTIAQMLRAERDRP